MKKEIENKKRLYLIAMAYLVCFLMIKNDSGALLSSGFQIGVLGIATIKRNKYTQLLFHINSIMTFMYFILRTSYILDYRHIIIVVVFIAMIITMNIYLLKTGYISKTLISRWNSKNKLYFYFDIAMVIIIASRFISTTLLYSSLTPFVMLGVFILLNLFKMNIIMRIIYYLNAIVVIIGNMNLIRTMYEKYNGEYEVRYVVRYLIMLWSIEIILLVLTCGILMMKKRCEDGSAILLKSPRNKNIKYPNKTKQKSRTQKL